MQAIHEFWRKNIPTGSVKYIYDPLWLFPTGFPFLVNRVSVKPICQVALPAL